MSVKFEVPPKPASNILSYEALRQARAYQNIHSGQVVIATDDLYVLEISTGELLEEGHFDVNAWIDISLEIKVV